MFNSHDPEPIEEEPLRRLGIDVEDKKQRTEKTLKLKPSNSVTKYSVAIYYYQSSERVIVEANDFPSALSKGLTRRKNRESPTEVEVVPA